jgi:hypothetical protein
MDVSNQDQPPPSETKRKLDYDGGTQANFRKKARDSRKTSQLVKLGVATSKFMPVIPKWYWTRPGITAGAILQPNYTTIQEIVEGTIAGSTHQNSNTTGGHLQPTAWLRPTDGQYGIMSYRANLGSEDVFYGTSTPSQMIEAGLGCCNIPDTLLHGKNAYLKTLHLKFTIKYLSSAPSAPEISLTEQAIMEPPPVMVRFMVVRQKRGKMGLPMYKSNDNSQADNMVSKELMLDPIGRPFGIDSYTHRNIPGVNNLAGTMGPVKEQTPQQHFTSPVQKKFFDVLCSHDFMLSPNFAQSRLLNPAYQSEALHTGKSYPSTKIVDLNIPINELVEYRQSPTATDNPPGNLNIKMLQPADLNVFDTKIICYAYCPSDLLNSWATRLKGYNDGPDLTVTSELQNYWSTAPKICVTHSGVMQFIDDA